jgi:hypothetical protein
MVLGAVWTHSRSDCIRQAVPKVTRARGGEAQRMTPSTVERKNGVAVSGV